MEQQKEMDQLTRAHHLIERWPDEARHPLTANHRADIADLTRLIYLLSLEASGLSKYLAKAISVLGPFEPAGIKALRCAVEVAFCLGYAAGKRGN